MTPRPRHLLPRQTWLQLPSPSRQLHCSARLSRVSKSRGAAKSAMAALLSLPASALLPGPLPSTPLRHTINTFLQRHEVGLNYGVSGGRIMASREVEKRACKIGLRGMAAVTTFWPRMRVAQTLMSQELRPSSETGVSAKVLLELSRKIGVRVGPDGAGGGARARGRWPALQSEKSEEASRRRGEKLWLNVFSADGTTKAVVRHYAVQAVKRALRNEMWERGWERDGWRRADEGVEGLSDWEKKKRGGKNADTRGIGHLEGSLVFVIHDSFTVVNAPKEDLKAVGKKLVNFMVDNLRAWDQTASGADAGRQGGKTANRWERSTTPTTRPGKWAGTEKTTRTAKTKWRPDW